MPPHRIFIASVKTISREDIFFWFMVYPIQFIKVV